MTLDKILNVLLIIAPIFIIAFSIHFFYVSNFGSDEDKAKSRSALRYSFDIIQNVIILIGGLFIIYYFFFS